MENKAGEMLEGIEKIINEHEESFVKYDDSYNIFDVLGLSTGETKMCRFLADLLNPYGAHKRGDKYLKSFFVDVLEWQNLNDTDMKRIQVFTEYRIDNGKRIDIVLENDKYFLPIEVKIESGDRENQCYDYYQYAKARSRQAKIVYLTKRGVFPTEYSLYSENGKERIPEEDIICISFSKDIRKWLEKNLETETGIVKLMVEQYLVTINNFTSVMDEELNMKISEKILETEDTLRTGLKIAEAMNKTKAMLIYKVMEEFEKQMEVIAPKYGLMKESEMNWFDYKELEAIETSIYSKKLDSGVNYIFKEIEISRKIQMWFRIEVDCDAIYAGYFLFDMEKEDMRTELNRTIKQKVKKYMISNMDFLGEWYYLPEGDDWEKKELRDNVPNFYIMNEAAISLVNKEKRVEFVKKSINTIEKILIDLLEK